MAHGKIKNLKNSHKLKTVWEKRSWAWLITTISQQPTWSKASKISCKTLQISVKGVKKKFWDFKKALNKAQVARLNTAYC